MSFDIHFLTGRFGEAPIEPGDPPRRKTRTGLPEEFLTNEELAAVEQVFRQAYAKGPDDLGCYTIELEDGGSAEVYASQLARGCMVALRGITPNLCQFLFHLLKAGNWVMLPVMEDSIAITTAPERLRNIPDNFPEVVICNSPTELGALLARGVWAWSEYRNQVLRDQ